MSQKLENIAYLKVVANALAELKDKVVFTGGVTVALYIDDPAIADTRPTVDVDCIMEVLSNR